MNYIKNNKELLFKYFLILIFNILIYFIFNNSFINNQYKCLLIMGIVLLTDLIIYYYMGTKRFVPYLDFICNIIIGIIMVFFINNKFEYYSIVFSILFANNIIFIRSRLSNNFIKRSLQYLLMFLYSILCLFITSILFLILN